MAPVEGGSIMQAASVASEAGAPKLKRELGQGMSTALVIGNMVGSGVFLLPASLAGVVLVSGSGSLLAWVLGGIVAMLLASVFANLGRAYPKTGGPYAYSRRAFGDFVGFQMAWGYWIAAWVGNAAITVAFVAYLSVFWSDLATNNLLAALVGIATIWLLTMVNVLGVRQGGIVQVVTTVLKFIPLAIIAIVGLFFMKAANFQPVAPNGWGFDAGVLGGITAAAALTLWAFIGLESATVPAEEVKDPKRTIPRASILGTGLTTIVYILATVAIVGIIPAARLAESASPFAAAAGEIFGGSWGKIVALVALASTFGALNGWILIQGRIPMAAARDGLFPKVFGNLTPKGRTPWVGIAVSSVLITGLMLLNYNKGLVDQFTFIIYLATLTTLIPYAFSAAAQVYLLFTDREQFEGRRLARDAIVGLVAFAFTFWAIYGSGLELIGQGYLLLLSGVPVYLYLKWRQGRGPLEAARVSKEAWQRNDEQLAAMGFDPPSGELQKTSGS
jgi:APA family basic amino acid/polyamine antiporter